MIDVILFNLGDYIGMSYASSKKVRSLVFADLRMLLAKTASTEKFHLYNTYSEFEVFVARIKVSLVIPFCILQRAVLPYCSIFLFDVITDKIIIRKTIPGFQFTRCVCFWNNITFMCKRNFCVAHSVFKLDHGLSYMRVDSGMILEKQ